MHPSVFDGLNFIFSDWDIIRRSIDDEVLTTVDELVGHYRDLSTKYGYTIPPPLPRLYDVAAYYTYHYRWDDAIAQTQAAIRFYPQAESLHELLAQSYFKKGDTVMAMKTVEKILELNPRNGEARAQLANLRATKPVSK